MGPQTPGYEKGGGKMMRKQINQRQKGKILAAVAAGLILAAVTVSGILLEGAAMETDFPRRIWLLERRTFRDLNWMGRDMFARTLAGLSLVSNIGILTAAVSAVIALLAGIAATALGRKADAAISGALTL